MTPPVTLASVPVHAGIEQWLAAAVTDELSPEERALFDAHLAGCAACRELFAEETAMNSTIQDAFDAVRPLPGFERRLTAAFRQRKTTSLTERLRLIAENAWRQPMVRVLGSVAVVIALIALGVRLTLEPNSQPGQIKPPVETQLDTGPILSNPVAAARNRPGGSYPKAGVVSSMDSQESGPASDPDMVARADTKASDFGLHGVNTYTGSTVVSAGARKISAFDGNVSKEGDVHDHRYDAIAGFGDSKTKIVVDAQYAGQNPTSAKAPLLGDVPLVGSLLRPLTRAVGDTDNPKSIYGSDAIGGVVNVKDFAANGSSDLRMVPRPLFETAQASATSVPTTSAALSSQPAPQNPALPAAPDSRKLIRNASVSLEVASFDPALDALGAAATQVGGGYIATADSTRQANGKRHGTIVIKVLPDKLDAFLARLHDLGTIKSQNIGTEDVTKDYFDTDARLRNARRMEDRLLKILDEDKGKLSEILQVEKELGRVREDIEKMQGQLQLYDALVRYATVTVDLFEKDLKQPATFLLHQTADLSLLAADVEKTYGEARHIAEDVHAQIENSELVRSDNGRVTASLRLLLAPEGADGVLTRLKGLARVKNFELSGVRTAQNGEAADTATGADAAKQERGPVTLNLSISHDETAYLRVTLTLTAADTAGAFDKARVAALAAGAEIVSAEFTRDQGPHGNGTLVLRVPANREAGLLDIVHSLGRTSDLHTQRDNDIAPDADLAPVGLTLHFADETMEREVSLTLFANDLDVAFDKTRAAALAAGGEVIASSFNQAQGQRTARLTLRLPGRSEAPMLALVRGLGRSTNFQVQRDAAASNTSDPDGGGPASLTINFADHEPPVQQTSVKILCSTVEKSQAAARRIATEAGAQVGSSTFTKGTDAGEEASLGFRLPLRAYPAFITRLRALGEVKDFNIHRQDSPAAAIGNAPSSAGDLDQNAPAEVSLQLYSQGRLVGDDSGLVATLRHTLAEGFGALMWSLRMIGVALAFLAPWVIALLVFIWLRRFVARRRAGLIPPTDPR
jgi:hypothetical protein